MKCCDITSGMMREPVEFQSQVLTDIGGGAQDISYTSRCNVRGYMRTTTGSERVHGDRLDAIQRLFVTIRYRSDILARDRAIIRGKAYQVRYINNKEFRDKFLEIELEGGVAT